MNLLKKKFPFEIIIDIPIYDYTLHIINLTNVKVDKAKNYLENEKFPQDIIDEIIENINLESYNGALTVHSEYIHDVYIFIYPHKEELRYKSTINHELFHAVCKVGNTVDIDEEARAYLFGYLTKKFYEFNILW